jgi:tetratricopeptide (TPR) repeat protein
MKFRLLLLLSALSWGFGAPASASDDADGTAAEADSAGPAATTTRKVADSGAPTELSADLIYSVLVGEVAVQRSNQRMAFTHYLYAARLARDPELAALAARAALALSDPQAGQRAVGLWRELDPESVKARQVAAYVQIEAGDRAGTLDALRELMALTPPVKQPYMQAAQLLARIDEPAERLALMQSLVEDAADNADAQFALATLAAAADETGLAREAAEAAAALRPDWLDPKKFIVQLLLAEGDGATAAAVLDGYMAERPEDRELQLLRAQLHIDAEQYEAALALYDALIDDETPDAETLFTAAVLAIELENLDQARTYLTSLKALGQRENDVAFLLGQVEQQAGDVEAAIAWYAQVDGPNASDAAVRVARLHAAEGEIDRAREMLQRLRDRLPEDSVTLFLIEGEMLRENGAEQQAMAVYDQAIEGLPDDPDLRYARAMVAVGLDRVDLLESDLRHILASDPDHADALNALGYTLADRTDRLEEARSLIEQAYALKPDEPAIKDSMGWVLYRLGDPAAAEPYLSEALKEAFDPEIAAHLGEVLWALGRREEATAIWDRALEEDPEHKYLLRILGKHRYSQTPAP